MLKRFIVLAVAFALLCSLTGCFYVVFDRYYELAQDTDQITSIGIYEHTGDNKLSDTALASLDSAEFEGFVTALEKLPFKNAMVISLAASDPSFYFGKYVVKITYSNGAYELISDSDYQEYYDSNGVMDYHHYALSSDKWEKFLSTYMDES